MRQVTETEIINRLRFDNPWWKNAGIALESDDFPKRQYLDSFFELVTEEQVRRAVILMGPRQVGKTTIIHQTIRQLLDAGIPSPSIAYVSLDTPTYVNLSLEKLMALAAAANASGVDSLRYVFFDEIQYLKDWEVHLKSLVDSFRGIRFVASGSAAAALKMKSGESGAGRFTDFLLPPLTFAEYLFFRKLEDKLVQPAPNPTGSGPYYAATDIERLNETFVEYLNFGGYPEAAYSTSVRANAERYIRGDVIDKVLLLDLPSLYGIGDIQDLNSFFTTLAYNTGQEVSYENLAQASGVPKNTLRKYLEYLEAAFLVRRLARVDRSARRFKRQVTFKVYLTSPSLRSALFGPVSVDDSDLGHLVETAIYDQWMHASLSLPNLYYARWDGGEIDFVQKGRDLKSIYGLIEVKWGDRVLTHPNELRAMIRFAKENRSDDRCLVTTRTIQRTQVVDGLEVSFEPASVYCYRVGKNALLLEPWLR